jgi:glycosyltransferase involved in cell wall biosynthesis
MGKEANVFSGNVPCPVPKRKDLQMRLGSAISVIIPMLNEESSIARVVAEIPNWVDEIIVVDNGSEDRSVEEATKAGARVLREGNRGYGNACLKGIASLQHHGIVVFLDGDYSDYPEEMSLLVDPIIKAGYEFVIGSRALGKRQPGALLPQARFGNWLSCFLIRLFWGVRFTDLGPFRAIRYLTLQALNMKDPNYGWTVEMQIKAARQKLHCLEVPVSYRKRIGKSKVTGTIKGVVAAGAKILWLIFHYAFMPSRSRPS